MSAKQKIEDLSKKMSDLQKEMKDEGQKAFKEALTELLKEYPVVEAVRWTQYTPYFNDGGPCEFSVHNKTVKFVGGDDEGGDDENGFYDSWSVKYYSEKGGEESKGFPQGALAAANAIHKFLSAVPDEIYLASFGDHVEVTATRDGLEVEHRDHD